MDGSLRAGTIALMVAGFAAFGMLALVNFSGGPTSETMGVVERFSFLPAEGTPTHVAMVRLADGTLVRASVAPNIMVQPGAVARVRLSKHTFTRGTKYELIAVEPRK